MPATYTWYNGATPVQVGAATYAVTVSGTYTVMATNVNGCQTELSLPLEYVVHPRPGEQIISPPEATVLCEGDSKELVVSQTGSTPATGYIWFLDGVEVAVTTTNRYTTEVMIPGVYEYRVLPVATTGCPAIDTSVVKVVEVIAYPDKPEITIPGSPGASTLTVRRGTIDITLWVGNPQTEPSYLWYHNEIVQAPTSGGIHYALPPVDMHHSGTYHVEAYIAVSDGKKCAVLSDPFLLRVESHVDVPNVVTPNGDGFNDALIIENLDLYESAELRIVNRWGNEVYRSADYFRSQNEGMAFTGSGLQDGIYFYTLSLKNIDGMTVTQTGWITLKHGN
jgi:gliding motility-associated-like protein